jgi:predicted outer membrane repeat protein
LAGDLRYCITRAMDGDTVRFGVQGIINLNSTLPDLTHSISIEGPGPDTLTVQVANNGRYRILTVDAGTTVTILGLTFADGNSYNSPGNGGAILNSGAVTVKNVNFASNSAADDGGAIYSSGVLTVSNATFSGNYARINGGGIYNTGTLMVSTSTFSGIYSEGDGGGIGNGPAGKAMISNSVFAANNLAGGFGGGIRNDGYLSVEGSTFTSNTAGSGGAIGNKGVMSVTSSFFSRNHTEDGGAILNTGSGTLTIMGSTFSGNVADNYGGGIFSEGTLTVSNSVFSSNGGHRGGVIYADNTLAMSKCNLSANGAVSGGGALFVGTAIISNCTLSGNRTQEFAGSMDIGGGTISCSTISNNTTGDPEFAGGIDDLGGTVIISNCTISGNTGGSGGIRNTGTLTVIDSTISGNTGGLNLPQVAGGITNTARFSGDATLTLLNCTVSGNTVRGTDRTASQLYSGRFRAANSGHATLYVGNTLVSGHGTRPNFFSDVDGSIFSQGHNLSNDDGSGFLSAAGDLINTDPMLGPLQDNGGPTQTMALLPGSPAVDAGDNTGAPDFDQRGPGFPRIVGGTIDFGAFEAQIGTATHLALSAPAEVASGSPFDVTVTALDAYGHTAAGYLGTVTFSSTDIDPGVMLPSDYTFSPDDLGVHTFVGGFTLVTPGDQTVISTDTTSGITGSGTVTVVPGPQAPRRRRAERDFGPITSADAARGQALQKTPEIASMDYVFASMISEEAGSLFANRSYDGTVHGVFRIDNG